MFTQSLYIHTIHIHIKAAYLGFTGSVKTYLSFFPPVFSQKGCNENYLSRLTLTSYHFFKKTGTDIMN